MPQYKFSFQTQKLPLKSRLILLLGTVLGVILLSMFAVTFIAVALVAGAVIFVISLLQRSKPEFPSPAAKPSIHIQKYKAPLERDDDVIDV